MHMWLERPNVHWKAYDVLAHQIVGLTIDFGEIDIDFAWNTIKRCYLYKDLTYDEFLKLLEFLDSIKLIKLNKEKSKIIKTRKGLLYYLENVSMIPDEKSYDVIDINTGTKIGILHEEFVAKHGEPGTIFILRGLPWKIEKIEKDKIYVSLEKDFESAIPSWEGELIPVPFEIAQLATKLKKENMDKFEELKNQKYWFIPDENKIFIESYKDWIIIHSPFGSKVNDTLSRIISYLISKKHGLVIGIKTDPYRILLKGNISKENVKEILENLPVDIENILKEALYFTDYFLWRFKHVARRFGVISKKAEYSKGTLRRIADSLKDSFVVEETFKEIFIEKLDIEKTKEIIRKIKEGKIKVEIINKDKPSPLAILALETYISDVMIADRYKEILRLVKERLENTEFYFVCINCKKVYGPIKVKDWKPFKCSCGSEYFGVIKRLEDLNKKNIDKILEATAELLKYYGKKFLMIYAGKGISYTVAAKLCSKKYNSEEEMLLDIIEYEKKFFKVRKYI